MKKLFLVAALGVLGGAFIYSPTLSPAANAQATPATQQAAVQAQLIAAAQAGNWSGFDAIVNAQLAAGGGAMLATIAGNISDMGLGLADVDANSAVALSLAAISLVDRAEVNSADATLAARVGEGAGKVKAKIVRRNPAGAAALAAAAARSTAPGLMIAYNTGQSATQQTGSTNTVVVVRQTPPRPGNVIVPIVPEPNPAQSGSPT